jgi:phage baseplate assembly protein W
VQGIDDIHQSLLILFGTIPGEDPFRPTFGVDLSQFLDKPITVATPAIVATISDAIALWEPRITVVSIESTYLQNQPAQLVIAITWQANLPNSQVSPASVGMQVTTWAVGGK